jgi:hypothetical protein
VKKLGVEEQGRSSRPLRIWAWLGGSLGAGGLASGFWVYSMIRISDKMARSCGRGSNGGGGFYGPD